MTLSMRIEIKAIVDLFEIGLLVLLEESLEFLARPILVYSQKETEMLRCEW